MIIIFPLHSVHHPPWLLSLYTDHDSTSYPYQSFILSIFCNSYILVHIFLHGVSPYKATRYSKLSPHILQIHLKNYFLRYPHPLLVGVLFDSAFMKSNMEIYSPNSKRATGIPFLGIYPQNTNKKYKCTLYVHCHISKIAKMLKLPERTIAGK